MSVLDKPGEKKTTGKVDPQKKKEAAKRHAEKVKSDAKQRVENAQKLKAELQKAGIFDKLSAELKGFVDSLTIEQSRAGGGSPVFAQIFGATPKIGDKKTVAEIFDLTGKGEATIDIIIKRWKDAGTIVTKTKDPKNFKNTTYTLTKIGE